MKNDSRITTSCKSDKAGAKASKALAKRSGNGMEGAGAHASEMGTGNQHAKGRDTRPALADTVSRAGQEKEFTVRLTEPITVTLTGPLAAAVRWIAYAQDVSASEYALEAIATDAAFLINDGPFDLQDSRRKAEGITAWMLGVEEFSGRI